MANQYSTESIQLNPPVEHNVLDPYRTWPSNNNLSISVLNQLKLVAVDSVDHNRMWQGVFPQMIKSYFLITCLLEFVKNVKRNYRLISNCQSHINYVIVMEYTFKRISGSYPEKWQNLDKCRQCYRHAMHAKCSAMVAVCMHCGPMDSVNT